MSAQGRRAKRKAEAFWRGAPSRYYAWNGPKIQATEEEIMAVAARIHALPQASPEQAERMFGFVMLGFEDATRFKRAITMLSTGLLKLAALGALVVCLALAGCGTTGDDEQPADAGAPDATCHNAFDDRCAATNGCGAKGAFCCYHFGDAGDVTDVCLASGTTCQSDICLEAP